MSGCAALTDLDRIEKVHKSSAIFSVPVQPLFTLGILFATTATDHNDFAS